MAATIASTVTLGSSPMLSAGRHLFCPLKPPGPAEDCDPDWRRNRGDAVPFGDHIKDQQHAELMRDNPKDEITGIKTGKP